VLSREINPKVFTKKEWEQMQGRKDAFIKEVMANPKLIIMGTADELG